MVRMALPVQQTAFLGSPVDPTHRDAQATTAQRAHHAKRRALDDGRRPIPARRQSLRRVKDSKEQLRTRTRGVSNATIESSTTSSTAGRSFTVANINHGIIYLRPVIRPATQRARPSPDPFVFPQTPPDSATLEPATPQALRPTSNEWEQSLYGSKSPSRADFVPPLPTDVKTDHESEQPRPARFDSPPRASASAHIRSRSFSTADEHTVTSHSTEPGTFKVVIERQPFGRPKTADTGTLPILEVPIPHYRLGTPRFSARGTAILRSSVYTSAAGTEDYRSSFLTPQRATNSFLPSRPRSDAYSPVPLAFRTTMDRVPLQPSTAPSSARVSRLPIGPQIYDALTTNPDDHAVVRFSSNGDILAATPSRLVAHITSPSFLDYELLSDFFLTFRSFLSGRDLVAYLISRLRWAVDRQDDFGRIVRVRTFVALRHWILNYFVDDFVPTYSLRAFFCDLVNSLHKDLSARTDGGMGDIKIVGELKKCWRRTCALYWDGEDGFGKDGANEDIFPGGRMESDVSADDEPSPLPQLPSTPPRQVGRSAKVETIGSNPSDHFASRHMDWAHKARHTPQNSLSSPYIPSQEYSGVQVPLSPASEHSMHVLSCSLPMRGLNKAEAIHDAPLYPHPVPHPVPASAPRLAASPQQATSKKASRPSHSHKRSGSFSDALRDSRAPLSLPKNAPTDASLSDIYKMPGSVIRGGLVQPSSPYIDIRGGGLRHMQSHLQLVHVDASGNDIHNRGGQATNPGMKKLFGSVRRALSSKQQAASTPQLLGGALHSHPPPSTRSSNPATISTISEGVHKRRYARARPQMRIDLLASVVAESFGEAVKEQIKSEQHQSVVPSLGGFEFEFEKRESDGSSEQRKLPEGQDHHIHSGITTGSQSIVIMDDTGLPSLPLMSGALPIPDTEDTTSNEKPDSARSGVSIDDRVPERDVPSIPSPEIDLNPSYESLPEWGRASRNSTSRSITTQQRSVSAGREQMHSFRRRGSTKASMARPASLRRRASHNSGLSRSQTVASIATFQTMSSDNDPFFLDQQGSDTTPGPARQLRRRPGGDLRAVDNVHDLEQLQRPHSTGTVSNRTHSIANSVILRSDRYMEPTEETSSQVGDGTSSPAPEKKPISLVATHSSQPNLRPSFEAEVAKLAALPDDTDDDGGIESALMKLEGRYERRSPDLSNPSPDLSPRVTMEPEVYIPTGAPIGSSNPSYIPSEVSSSRTRSYAKGDDVFHRPLAPPEAEGQGMYRLSGEAFNRRVPAVNSAIESEDSYSSIPLLDRGLSGITSAPRAPTMDTMRSSAKPAPLNTLNPSAHLEGRLADHITSANSSIEYIIETDSMKRIPRDGTMPASEVSDLPRESFLLDDDEDLSDMGSVRETRSDGTSHGVRSFFEDEPAVDNMEKDFLPTHPMRHPPTPPLTANRLNDSLPRVDTTVLDRGLPTPGLTPTSRFNNQPFGQTAQPVEPAIELQELKKDRTSSPPAHFPFILAYDSETLAQQLTIVEKDALDEIDWRELIELRWTQSSPQIRDWVQYLRTQEARGVDVVIARFNLVVKWAVSECILTEGIEERSRCIVKFIHIAAHARRLRNYATMYQITIALLSNDIARLRKTWALVPAIEIQIMRELEALVQPLRNFHNLRVEMETATVEEGCIPFIGIYTRDLIYNSQKPAFIDTPPIDGERLVNFERHHTAATIVKSLLRLLEASSKYTFKPDPNIISKCLWLAALSDAEIIQRSRQYE